MLLRTFGQAYDPAALPVKVKAILLENGTLAEVEIKLPSVCGKDGIILVVAKSSRVDDGSSNTVDMKKLVCQRAGKGRRDQEQYLLSLDNGRRMPSAGAVFAGHVYILEYFVVCDVNSETGGIKRYARGARQVDISSQCCRCCLLYSLIAGFIIVLPSVRSAWHHPPEWLRYKQDRLPV